MLTDSEREWLEDRKHKAYCRYCDVSNLCANPFASGYFCPLSERDMKDAAEFSERVAVKLAEGIAIIPYLRPADALKFARFAVEEEMDNG